MTPLAQLAVKAAVSGLLVACASEVARRSAGWGGLVASLPLVSLLAMVWLWRDGHDPERVASFALSTAAYVSSSLPAFVVLAILLRRGFDFWPSLTLGAATAVAGYVAVGLAGRRFGLPM